MLALVPMILRDNKVLNQDKGQNKKHSQNLHKFLAPKGITHQKIFRLKKAIMPSTNIIGGYLKRIHTICACNPICKPKNQLNAKPYANKKRNLKLYSLTRMQTKTKIEYIKTTHSPCLDKALLFKGKKVRE